MSATLKIISLNVKGISNFKKRRTIFTWCRRKNADVILLQETHSNKTTEIQWKNEWGGKMLFSHGSPNSCGTAILILILGGDFNCPLNPNLDKRGGIMIPRKSVVNSIECLQNELDLVDIWRVKILKQEAILGVKNHLLYYVVWIFGLFLIIFVILSILRILSLR